MKRRATARQSTVPGLPRAADQPVSDRHLAAAVYGGFNASATAGRDIPGIMSVGNFGGFLSAGQTIGEVMSTLLRDLKPRANPDPGSHSFSSSTSCSCKAEPLLDSMSGTSMSKGCPLMPETRPPASSTISAPAAMSHGLRLLEK